MRKSGTNNVILDITYKLSLIMGKGTLGVRVSEHGAGQFEGRVECSQFTQQPVR